jgi:hypothetical protein
LLFLKNIVRETINPKPNAKVRGVYWVLMGKPAVKGPRGRAREITMAFLFFTYNN